MTVLDPRPRRTAAAWQPRLERRHEIVTTGGMAGVLGVGAALHTCGYQVHEFVVDVQDGVPYGSVTCTVALTAAEAGPFAERLREVPAVIAVDQR
ncbi:MAG TPA: hypothetical protein VF667_10585 [Pseudonocardia sp.]